MIQQRKKRNSSKINLIISLVFHGALVVVVFWLAATNGMLGKKLKQITVTMVKKEKPPEPPKEKPPEQKIEQPKLAETPKINVPQPKVETASAPPPAATTPAAAPAAVSLPSFQFSDGAKEVQTISDPNGLYKAFVEYTLRSHWNRPDDPADDKNVAEVELTLDKSGEILDTSWVKGSGDSRWDGSVRDAVAAVKTIGKAPPKNFPQKVLVRFDVQVTEPIEGIQLTAQ